jgi:hypothetical protein
MSESNKAEPVAKEPMFVEKPKVEEVIAAPPVKIKKPRKPMSEERKEILREQLKKAREIKKAKKEQKNAAERPSTPMPAPAPEIKLVVEPTEVGGHSIPVVVKKPRKPRVKKERNELPKIDESIELRKQLDELRAANKSKENELLKQQIANQKLKNAQDKPIKIKKVTEKVLSPKETDSAPPVEKKKARYSTYKKSVWAEYGV